MFPFTEAAASRIIRPTAVAPIITIRDLNVAFRIIQIYLLVSPMSVNAKFSIIGISNKSFMEGHVRGNGLGIPNLVTLLSQSLTLHPQWYIG